ncbi:ABC transporter ATP-binding protein [Flaviflexus salsibiostraticola]|uniref:ABC transporter ATP-binding protein n=1 Tax=Flaviflexus salsibiostraticola TaxID=1282737 RepID=A0A3S8Z902_9ACTO|nr:ABC transporter ATP-binding protein [Flaviflexus salsibiostraticola]AZN29855.1 ABC transporter ATP-binding protein [Flaviflexus salsibiostraticola]
MSAFTRTLAPVDDPVVVVRDLKKTFGLGTTLVHALRGIDLKLGRGELTAIMGPSGSGKSTLMHCIAGLEGATSGQVLIDGKEVTAMKESELTRLRRDHIGFIFQSFNLVPTLNARENITLPATIAGRTIDQDHFDRVVETVGLGDRLEHRPTELSGGQQQRVACARAMVGSPDVVFADEPTGNLDSTAAEQILQFLRTSVDELGQSVVMVTHEPDSAAWADRVVILRDGQILGELRNPTRDTILDALRDGK